MAPFTKISCVLGVALMTAFAATADARIAANRLAGNRIAAIRIAANKLSSNKLSSNTLPSNQPVIDLAGDGSFIDVTAIELPNGLRVAR